MKLKKIVSLALAGIMAVSMLTACGEGDSNSIVTPRLTTPLPLVCLLSWALRHLI